MFIVEWDKITTGRPKIFELERSTDLLNYSNIANFNGDVLDYIDENVNVNSESYSYRLKVIDSCDYNSPYSNIGKSILLSVENTEEFPVLSWTPYLFWPSGIEKYSINVSNKYGNNELLIKNVDDSVSTYIDNRTTLNQANYCYRISAVRNSDGQLSYSNTVCIETPFNIFVPTAFTPNGDGLNDEVVIKGSFIVDFTMQVFSRWGELMYETHDINKRWDGTYKGELCPEGEYYLYIYSRGTLYQHEKYKGTIMLLRNE